MSATSAWRTSATRATATAYCRRSTFVRPSARGCWSTRPRRPERQTCRRTTSRRWRSCLSRCAWLAVCSPEQLAGGQNVRRACGLSAWRCRLSGALARGRCIEPAADCALYCSQPSSATAHRAPPADLHPAQEVWVPVAAQVCGAGQGRERTVQQLHAPGEGGGEGGAQAGLRRPHQAGRSSPCCHGQRHC